MACAFVVFCCERCFEDLLKEGLREAVGVATQYHSGLILALRRPQNLGSSLESHHTPSNHFSDHCKLS